MSAARYVGRILSSSGAVTAVLLATAAAWLDATSVGRTIDHLFYDRYLALDAATGPIAPNVVLVDTEADLERHADSYLDLIERLNAQGAAGVGIVQLDARQWSAEQLARLGRIEQLVVGHLTTGADSAPGVTRASVDLPASLDGIHRHYAGRTAPGIARPLAVQLADRSSGAARRQTGHGELFGVRFCGSTDGLPHVSAERVLRGEVPDTLIRARAVVLGRPADPTQPGLRTPSTRDRLMSVVEYHGHALNTLIADRAVVPLARVGQWVLLLCGAVVIAAACRRLDVRLSIPLVVGALLLQGLAAWLALSWWDCWLPLGTVLVVESCAALWSFDRRLRFCQQAWPQLSRQGNSRHPRFQDPTSLRAGESPWPLISATLESLFPIEHSALLLAVPRQERLVPAAQTVETSRGVLQWRRDLQRRPFDESVRRRVAVRIDGDAPYFPARSGHAQYFVPLFHGQRFKGVLIVELSEAALDQLPGFCRQLTDAATEFAAWLSRYNALSSAARRQRRLWNRLTSPPELHSFRRLRGQLHLLERRLYQADQLVEQSSVAEAVFDLGGTAITINSAMFRLLHAWQIGNGETRLLEVLQALTVRSASECRQAIRRVVIERRRERMIAREPNTDQPVVLVLQPVLCFEQHADDPSVVQAFNVQAIHLEILSSELLCDIHEVREQLADQTLSTVLDTLGDVSALAAHARESVPPDAWRRFSTTIRRAQLTVQRCQSLLASGESEDLGLRLPVQVSTLLRAAMVETRAIAEQWQTVVTLNLPDDLPVVAANPHRLREVISATLTVLVEHAPENSRIGVSAARKDKLVVLTFENPDCGAAIDRLAYGQRREADRPLNEAERLMMAREWLLQWGGDLQIEADLGAGARVQLTLPAFDWCALPDPTTPSDERPCPRP